MQELQIASSKLYYTSDFGCCVGLVGSGFKIIELDRSDPRRVRFGFERTQKLLQAIDEYWGFGLLVPSRSYFEASKRVKAMIYGDEA
jgi:hypothetical protein